MPSNLQSSDPHSISKPLLNSVNKTELFKSDINDGENVLDLPKIPPDGIDTYYFNKHAVVEFLNKKQHSFNTKMDNIKLDELSN